ncbi:hypothetical protein ACH5AO_35050 [Streptomyces sp. NPDC018964]|uniref:hypothetical protein n=1 Tax=unclassified Streptomyces TaxID=2593676 RepID=UPI0037A4E0D7
MNKAAYTAGGLASAGHLDEIIALALLCEAVEIDRPWQAARHQRVATNAFAAGSARPLHLKGPS